MQRYNPKEIEPKWQKTWEDSKIYQATEDKTKPKKYILEYFPYPSGAAMHVGHVRNYTIGDVLARFNRMQGFNVLHPMGWDGFGLPAENYAIKNQISPRVAIDQNTTKFRQQLTQMGFSYDWSREIDSTSPEYYRWTQWFFLLLYKKGLAYQKESPQWWCPVDKTVLANEQVEAGRCWRCGNLVEKKLLKQWFFKITDYADRLSDDLDNVNWSDAIKAMQRNWIGKSKGAEIEFKIEGHDDSLTVFTTRPDTLFGATFMVLSPEHPLINKITTDGQRSAVETYQKEAQAKSDIERQETNREKTGVFTGAYANNPINGEKIPVWIADYVLMGYGTGAIMAVPAHDERDNEFAKKFDLPITQVIVDYHVYEDEIFAPREGKETLERPTVDAIITDGKGNYLLESENEDNVHFVGGGIDDTDESAESALRREIQEEVGFTDIISIGKPTPYTAALAYRHTKDKNQKTWGRAYEVVVNPDVQVESEIEQGRHAVEWVVKDEVAAKLTWHGHQKFWDAYTNDSDKVALKTGEGLLVNSGTFNGTESSTAREEIVAWLEKQGAGHEKTTYKMRDWLISRQRYWGAPIPMIHCPKDGIVPVPEDQLPVKLPELEKFEPSGDGRSPLANVPEFVNVTCPQCGGPAERETDTMDGFACSSWYFLRFADPHNDKEPFSKDKADFWLPVDDYIGGAEHAVMHLLYARMWTKVMHDEGMIDFDEPFTTLRNQGMILAPDGQKMSKSKGNTIEPGVLIDQGYGADSIRIMELFIGPWNQSANWSVEGMGGSFRFLQRIWTLANECDEARSGTEDSPELHRALHKTIKKVTEDIESLSFNTAIATLMEFVNELYRIKAADKFDAANWTYTITVLIRLIAPFAPHIAEELWQQYKQDGSVHVADWPKYDEKYLTSDTITVVVQVNGKLRGELQLPADAEEAAVVAAAQKDEKVAAHLSGHEIRKTIYVPGKLVNFVV